MNYLALQMSFQIHPRYKRGRFGVSIIIQKEGVQKIWSVRQCLAGVGGLLI